MLRLALVAAHALGSRGHLLPLFLGRLGAGPCREDLLGALAFPFILTLSFSAPLSLCCRPYAVDVRMRVHGCLGPPGPFGTHTHMSTV